MTSPVLHCGIVGAAIIALISQGECTVTELPICFKLYEIKVSLCSKKMTKPYDPLFRNTREKRVNIREDICRFSYSLFCAVFYKVWCGRAVIGVVFLVVTSVVRISLLDFFFFFNFVLHIFQVPFLFSSFIFCLSYIVNIYCLRIP